MKAKYNVRTMCSVLYSEVDQDDEMLDEYEIDCDAEIDDVGLNLRPPVGTCKLDLQSAKDSCHQIDVSEHLDDCSGVA